MDVYLGNPERPHHSPEGRQDALSHGRTDMFAGMALIAEFHRPDIGIVPIGDRFTMGARSAAFTCKKFFNFEMILPCHYGTFPGMLDPDADKFVAEMKGHNVVVPKVGQTRHGLGRQRRDARGGRPVEEFTGACPNASTRSGRGRRLRPGVTAGDGPMRARQPSGMGRATPVRALVVYGDDVPLSAAAVLRAADVRQDGAAGARRLAVGVGGRHLLLPGRSARRLLLCAFPDRPRAQPHDGH